MNEDSRKGLGLLEMAVSTMQAPDSEPSFLAEMVQLLGRALIWLPDAYCWVLSLCPFFTEGGGWSEMGWVGKVQGWGQLRSECHFPGEEPRVFSQDSSPMILDSTTLRETYHFYQLGTWRPLGSCVKAWGSRAADTKSVAVWTFLCLAPCP